MIHIGLAKGFRRLGRWLNNVGNGLQWLGNQIQPPKLSPEFLAKDAREKAQQARIDAFIAAGGDSHLRFSGYDLTPSSVVFDVGGYIGTYAAEMHARYQCQVHIFEPCPRFCEHIGFRLGRNPAFHLHPFGLASATQIVKMSMMDEGTSLYRTTEESFEARLVRAADFFAAEQVKHIDLLKINIEGGEYDLLPHLIDTGLMALVRDVQIQFHEDVFPDAAERVQAIREGLSRTHKVMWQYDWVWESWRRKSDTFTSS